MVSDYLQRHGYQVAHERSGERAVTRILAEKPALVLLDVGLPDQDGFEVCPGAGSGRRRLHRQADRTAGAAGPPARPPAPPPPGRAARRQPALRRAEHRPVPAHCAPAGCPAGTDPRRVRPAVPAGQQSRPDPRPRRAAARPARDRLRWAGPLD
ncbi:hypothetical protein G6F24_016676 [Rhizopus arrhizus]|nr:hypothetical protein G6F24_016676 [Rhizopus arrhizus]